MKNITIEELINNIENKEIDIILKETGKNYLRTSNGGTYGADLEDKICNVYNLAAWCSGVDDGNGFIGKI